MGIDSRNFRDKAITQVTIGYDWVDSLNFALISVMDADKVIFTYRVAGLTEYCLYDDFECMYISQCKFIDDDDGLYISLDPFNELAPREERDCFCFLGKSIEISNGK